MAEHVGITLLVVCPAWKPDMLVVCTLRSCVRTRFHHTRAVCVALCLLSDVGVGYDRGTSRMSDVVCLARVDPVSLRDGGSDVIPRLYSIGWFEDHWTSAHQICRVCSSTVRLVLLLIRLCFCETAARPHRAHWPGPRGSGWVRSAQSRWAYLAQNQQNQTTQWAAMAIWVYRAVAVVLSACLAVWAPSARPGDACQRIGR